MRKRLRNGYRGGRGKMRRNEIRKSGIVCHTVKTCCIQGDTFNVLVALEMQNL